MANIRLELTEDEFKMYYLFSAEKAAEEPVMKALNDKLENKLDKMIDHDLYTRYKCAPTDEEKEAARQEYLDRRGVPDAYRWKQLRGEIH